MINEDYVSFETAKLLKEKGFDWDCESKKFYPEPDYDQESPNGVYATTLQMAMKWLRKKYNLEIYPYHNYDNSKWWYEIIKYPNSVAEYECGNDEELDTYEEACESAIKYCLENLI